MIRNPGLTEEEKKKVKEWLLTRPQSIRDLVEKYPLGAYRIKENAPYAISRSGTKVMIFSYYEDGRIDVIVIAKYKLPETLEHEKRLAERSNKLDDIENIHKQSVKVNIDPAYLEKIDDTEIEYDTDIEL